MDSGPAAQNAKRPTRPSPTKPEPWLRKVARRSRIALRGFSSQGTKAPALQIAWFLCRAQRYKGTTTLESRPASHPVVPLSRLALQRNHDLGKEGAARPLGAFRETAGLRPLGAFRETRAGRRPLEALAHGSWREREPWEQDSWGGVGCPSSRFAPLAREEPRSGRRRSRQSGERRGTPHPSGPTPVPHPRAPSPATPPRRWSPRSESAHPRPAAPRPSFPPAAAARWSGPSR